MVQMLLDLSSKAIPVNKHGQVRGRLEREVNGFKSQYKFTGK